VHFDILKWVFGLTLAYLVVEIAGGLWTGSLALLADGFHMFADATGIGLSLLATWLSHRPAPLWRTFGYQRAEIMAAFFNGLILVAMGLFILLESFDRFSHPARVEADLMTLIAGGGLLVNAVAAWLLHKEHHANLNIKGAYLHVLGDLLGSVGAMAAGGLILFFGWNWADPAISVLIAFLVMFSAASLLKDALNVLLEGCPAHIDIDQIHQEMLKCDGVLAVHHLHVWNINLQRALLTAHLEVKPGAYTGETLTDVQNMLKERFGLSHVTLQLEVD
jgi:cobalt-zinc-cadmium efflux system protein